MNFVNKAINMEMKLAEDRRILAERNLSVLEEEGKRTKNNAEFEERLASARIAVNNATRDALNKTKELASQRVEALNSIKAEEKAEEDRRKAAYEKRLTAIEKARDAEIKADTATLALKVANQGKLDELRLLDENYLQQRLNYLEENAEGEKAIVEKQLQFKKISAQEAALKLIEIEQNKNDQLKNLESKKLDLVIANLEYKAEFAALKLEEELAGKIRTDEEMHLSELLRIQRDKEARINELELRLKNEPEKEEQIKEQIALVTQRARTAIAKQDADFAAKQNDLKLSAHKTNLANELELARGNINKEHDLKLQQLEAERLAEIEAAEKTGADVALINEKYAQFEQDLAEETRQKKIENVQQYATAVADAFSELNELLYALGEREIQDAEEKNNVKNRDLDQKLKAGLISQQEHDYEVARSAYELDVKKDKLEQEAAKRAKALAITMAIINTAGAIIAALTTPLAGPALAVAAGIAGAVQLAAIIATPIPSGTAGTAPKFEDFAPGDSGNSGGSSSGEISSGKNESQKALDKAAEEAKKIAERAQNEYEKAVEKAEKAVQDAKDLADKIAQDEKDRADKAIMDAWEKSDRAIAEASKRADEISARAQQTLADALSNLEKAQQTVLDIQAKIDKKAADKLAAEEDARIKALEDAEKLIFEAEQEANKQAENAQKAAEKAIEVAQQKELAYLELLRETQESNQNADDLQRIADEAKSNYTRQASMLWYQPELKAALRKQAEDAQRAADKAKEDAEKQAEKLEKQAEKVENARIEAENAKLAAEQAIKVASDSKAAQSAASEAAKQAALAAEERARLAAEAAQRASDEEDAAWQRELEAAKQAEIEAQEAAEQAKIDAEKAKIDAEIAAQKKLEAELAAEARRAAYDAEQEEKRRKANEEAQAKADKTAQEAQQAANEAAKAAALANEAAALAAAAAGWSVAEKVNPTSLIDTNLPVVTPRGDYNFNSSGYTFQNDGGYQNRSTQENTVTKKDRYTQENMLTKRDIQEAMADAVSEIKVYATIEDIRKEDKNYLLIENRASY